MGEEKPKRILMMGETYEDAAKRLHEENERLGSDLQLLNERNHELIEGRVTLKIGKYTLRLFDGTKEGGLWLEHESGEGMQQAIDKIEKHLDKVWEGF